MEQENFQLPEEFLLEFTENQVEEFEDEGNFHIFQRRFKDLKKKIMSIDLMICNYKGQDFNSIKKRVYLEGISNYLKEIASSIN